MAELLPSFEVDDPDTSGDISISDRGATATADRPDLNGSEPAVDNQPASSFGDIVDENLGEQPAAGVAGDDLDGVDPNAAPSDFRSRLAGMGFTGLEGMSDEQLAASIAYTHQQAMEQQQAAQLYQRQLQESQQLAAYGRQYLAMQQQQQAAQQQGQNGYQQPGQQFAQPGQQQFAPQAQQPAGRPKQPPEFDQRWMNLVQNDPNTGRLVPVDPNVPNEIVQKANAYADWRRERADLLIDNYVAPEVMREQLAQELRQQWQADLQSMQRQQQEQQFAVSALNELSPIIHQRDQTGRVLIDPNTQRPALSQAGYQYANFVQQLHMQGVRDPQVQDSMARLMLQGVLLQQQRQQQAAIQQPPAGQPAQVAAPAVAPGTDPTKAAFLARRNGNNGNTRRPQQNGAVLRDQTPTGRNEAVNWSNLLDHTAQRMGIVATR